MGSLVRLAAVIAGSCVALSFLLFAVDQSEEGSATQINAVAGVRKEVSMDAAIGVPSPPSKVERVREARHTGIREAIDDVNDVLSAPFTGLISTNNVWAERVVTAVPALLLFGLGGMLLANFIPQPRREPASWREATN